VTFLIEQGMVEVEEDQITVRPGFINLIRGTGQGGGYFPSYDEDQPAPDWTYGAIMRQDNNHRDPASAHIARNQDFRALSLTQYDQWVTQPVRYDRN
jgi:hypothetical protein